MLDTLLRDLQASFSLIFTTLRSILIESFFKNTKERIVYRAFKKSTPGQELVSHQT